MTLRKIVLAIAISATVVWLAGAAFIFSVVTPLGCPRPFQVYAVTWPIWAARVTPEPVLFAIVKWSLTLCP